MMSQLAVRWKDTDTALDQLVVRAESLKITDGATYAKAQVFLMGLKNLDAEIAADYKPQKQAVDKAKSVLLEQERKKRGPVAEAREIITEKITDWDTEQRRLEREAQAKAAEESKRTGAVVVARPAETATVDGFGFSTTYKAVVLDKAALIRAVHDGKVSDTVLEVVMPVANDFARTAGPQTKAQETPGEPIPMPGVPGLGIIAVRTPRGK